MENKRLHRINNERFTVRLCTIARVKGFKTVGKFYDFLQQVKPTERIYQGTTHNRVSKIKRELENYLNNQS